MATKTSRQYVRVILLSVFILLLTQSFIAPGQTEEVAAAPAKVDLPDLNVTLHLDPPAVSPGEPVTLFAEVQNEGTAVAVDHTLALHLPDGLYLAAAGEAGARAGESAPATAYAVDTALPAASWPLAKLEPGQSYPLQVKLMVAEQAAGNLTIRLKANEATGQTAATGYTVAWSGMGESGGSPPEPGGWVFRPNEPFPALFSGAASYSVPLETPPARGGIGPNLALHYSSRATDAQAAWHDSNRYGEAWDMSGLPFITRVGAHYCNWQPSEQYHICFHGGYELHLDGGHELAYVGGCGADCDLYEADDAPGLRVEHYRSGGANELKSYWLVRQPDGRVYRFGYYEDAEQVIALACPTGEPESCGVDVYRWYLDKLEDPFNNQMVVLYDERLAPTDFWNCAYAPIVGHDLCREADVWPVKIRYNNSITNPDRAVQDHWQAEVHFEWFRRNKMMTAQPIFVTEVSWEYGQNYILMRTRNESGVWWDKWRYVMTQHNVPCNDEGNPYCADNSIRRVLDSIQRIESNNVAWPATTFEYNDSSMGAMYETGRAPYIFCWPISESCTYYKYPYLLRARNGYGAVYEFTYEGLPHQYLFKSYHVSDFKVWDGVNHIYGQHPPTRHHHFTYEEPCYHAYGQCFQGAGGEGLKLVGYWKTYVDTYNYVNGNQTFLYRDHYAHLVPNHGGGHPLLFGKEYARSRYADAAATIRLQTTLSDWALNDSPVTDGGNYWGQCQRNGLAVATDWACLWQVRTKQFEPVAGVPMFSGGGKKLLMYDASSTGGRQLGIQTRTDTSYSVVEDAYVLNTRNVNKYAVNLVGNQWVALPRAGAVYDVNWQTLAFTLHLYGANLDPDNQTVVRGNQLTWSRALVQKPVGATAVPTVDSHFTYGQWGLLEASKSFANYGTQTLVPNNWLPMSAADSSPTRPGAVSTVQYKANGTLVDWVENAAGHRVTYEYGGANAPYPWLINKITGPTGLTTDYRYDTLMRLGTVIGPEATESSPSLTYDYQFPAAAGEPLRITQITHPNESSIYRSETETLYDGLGRALQSRAVGLPRDDNAQLIDLVTVQLYDGFGRPVCQTLPYEVTSGGAAPSCYLAPHTETAYDLVGRVWRTTAPDGSQTTLTYAIPGMSGWVGPAALGGTFQIRTEDAAGNVAYQTMDSLGRVAWVGQVETGAGCSHGRLAITRYSYDTLGNLTQVERGGILCGATYDASEVITTTIAYDMLSRKTEMVDPDMGHWFYTYDPAGNITEQRAGEEESPEIILTCAAFDHLNRLTDQWEGVVTQNEFYCDGIPAPNDPRLLAHYTYVTNPNNPGLGQVAQVMWNAALPGITGSFADAYTYDSLGRLKQHTRTVNDRPYTQEVVAYDRLSRPLTVRLPDGELLTTTYDAWGANHLQSNLTMGSTGIGQENGSSLISNVLVNTRGQRTLLARGNGVNTTYQYGDVSQNFRLSQVSVAGPTGNLINLGFTYDLVGQIETLSSTINGQADNQSFTYDGLGRLKSASGSNPGYLHSYAYDNLGSLEHVFVQEGSGVRTTTYVAAPDHPHAVGQITESFDVDPPPGPVTPPRNLAYDRRGNMIYREAFNPLTGNLITHDQTFDVWGRLTTVAVTENGGTAITGFAYGPAGSRVLTVHSDGAHHYTPFPGYEEIVANGLATGRTAYNMAGSIVAQRDRTTYLEDDFQDGNANGWTPHNGNWAVVESGVTEGEYEYRQSDLSSSPYSNRPVNQDQALVYEWTATFESGNDRVGIHFFADSNSHVNHGNSYHVRQHGTAVRIYESINNTLYQRASVSKPLGKDVYAYRVAYDPATGQIDVWRDGEFVLSWTDTTPLAAGSYLGLRTNGSAARFDNVRVYAQSLLYLHGDHLGSASLLTYGQGHGANTGQPVPDTLARYLPFGGYRVNPGTDLTDRGFTGHKHNDPLGLIYMNARYYVPETRRFASADTLVPQPGNTMGYNRYAYVNNNPVNLNDPSGHCAEVTAYNSVGQPYQMRDPSDAVCWDQYDALIEAGANPGSGLDYQFRTDFDIIFALRQKYNLPWDVLLSQTWDYARDSNGNAVEFTGDYRTPEGPVGWELLMLDNHIILADGVPIYLLWMETSTQYIRDVRELLEGYEVYYVNVPGMNYLLWRDTGNFAEGILFAEFRDATQQYWASQGESVSTIQLIQLGISLYRIASTADLGAGLKWAQQAHKTISPIFDDYYLEYTSLNVANNAFFQFVDVSIYYSPAPVYDYLAFWDGLYWNDQH